MIERRSSFGSDIWFHGDVISTWTCSCMWNKSIFRNKKWQITKSFFCIYRFQWYASMTIHTLTLAPAEEGESNLLIIAIRSIEPFKWRSIEYVRCVPWGVAHFLSMSFGFCAWLVTNKNNHRHNGACVRQWWSDVSVPCLYIWRMANKIRHVPKCMNAILIGAATGLDSATIYSVFYSCCYSF